VDARLRSRPAADVLTAMTSLLASAGTADSEKVESHSVSHFPFNKSAIYAACCTEVVTVINTVSLEGDFSLRKLLY